MGSREDVLTLIMAAPPDLRHFLIESSRKLLEKDDLEDVVSGCFDTSAGSQAAVPRVLAVLRTLANAP